jgi:hypothetical protein
MIVVRILVDIFTWSSCLVQNAGLVLSGTGAAKTISGNKLLWSKVQVPEQICGVFSGVALQGLWRTSPGRFRVLDEFGDMLR